jgi:dienelactone hydrolase
VKRALLLMFFATSLHAAPKPAVIFVHWGLGDHHAFADEAVSLKRLGVEAVLIHAPLQGDEAAELRACVLDVRRQIDLLVKRKDIDAKRIAFVGLSFGAHVGALLVPVESRIRAYVLMGGLAEAAVKEPHAAPIFFQFARHDEYISYAEAAKFVDAASGARVAKWYEGGHQFNEAARRDRVGWLSTILGFPLPDANYFPVAASEAPASDLGRYAELAKFGVVIDIPGMQRIAVRRGIAYRGALKFDAYYPFGMEPKLRVPAVVLVSGQAGPELMRNLRGVRFNTTLARATAARANRIVIVPDLRGASDDEVASDLQALLAYLRAHAGELQIDGDSMAIWARSAGGTYGLRVAAADFVKAVVVHYGKVPTVLQKPMLVVTAGHDDYAGPAPEAPNITHIHIADGEHGFDTVNDYEDSRDALLRTFIFLHDHLPIRR